RGTPGLSGADLENLLNEAALGAARRDADRIGAEDLEEARDRILMGLERRSVAISDDERELLAYHEAGHAVVAASLPTTDPVHKVTIIPRGRAMGVTQQLPERERYVYRRDELLERVAVLLGGRAAEELVFETRSSGAQDDLKRATELARRMVLQLGMSERLGPLATGGEQEVFLGEEIARRREFSEETAREIDEEVKRVLEEARDRARDTLAEPRGELDAVAERLLEEEEIDGEEILRLIGREEAAEG
ncbi:MAG: cell division protein FtsH, partial [Gemmatimonadota bacterium]|nr:cell division protein FtsH [Gemmatimonadota bacterium]